VEVESRWEEGKAIDQGLAKRHGKEAEIWKSSVGTDMQYFL